MSVPIRTKKGETRIGKDPDGSDGKPLDPHIEKQLNDAIGYLVAQFMERGKLRKPSCPYMMCGKIDVGEKNVDENGITTQSITISSLTLLKQKDRSPLSSHQLIDPFILTLIC